MTNALATRYRARDPFSVARSLFGLEPFFTTEAANTKVAFNPRFEVKEVEDGYVFVADLPGLKESDLDISLHNNVLTISGSRASEERKEGETYFLYERQYGSFSRSFALPDEANAEAVDAALQDGVLTVNVGKKAESKPRKIALKK